jgi:hypothetical protein
MIEADRHDPLRAEGNVRDGGSTLGLGRECGMAVVEQGGNAFDAAVAAGFVLEVGDLI